MWNSCHGDGQKRSKHEIGRGPASITTRTLTTSEVITAAIGKFTLVRPETLTFSSTFVTIVALPAFLQSILPHTCPLSFGRGRHDRKCCRRGQREIVSSQYSTYHYGWPFTQVQYTDKLVEVVGWGHIPHQADIMISGTLLIREKAIWFLNHEVPRRDGLEARSKRAVKPSFR